MLQGRWSVANVCTALARALVSRFDRVGVQGYNGGDYADPGLLDDAFVDADAPVGVYYGFPLDIGPAFNVHPVRIGGFVCETDRIDPRWVAVCNDLDLVIVPSRWCRDAFVRSGVQTPVMVVPHGLEPEYRPLRGKERARPLVFYDTFHATSGLERKGVDELVEAFLEAFGPSGREAVLCLRTPVSAELAAVRGRHDFGDGIRLWSWEDLDTASFAALYSEVHCTVHPSRGEGFGLVPLQSIACETPVIATAATGMADYLTPENALCLRTDGWVDGIGRAGSAVGRYPRPDVAHLTELLVHVRDRWEDEYDRVRRAGPGLRAAYAWPTVLAPFLEAVHACLELGPGPALAADLRERASS